MGKISKVADLFEKKLRKIKLGAWVDGEWKDILMGGEADEHTPDDFEQEALEEGAEIEMEHTDDKEVATEIAMDHLTELPVQEDVSDRPELEDLDYYALLKFVTDYEESH